MNMKKSLKLQGFSFKIYCGRWGEVEIEKGPVDLFPTEPTDEDRQVEEILKFGFKGFIGLRTKKKQVKRPVFCFTAEDGT